MPYLGGYFVRLFGWRNSISKFLFLNSIHFSTPHQAEEEANGAKRKLQLAEDDLEKAEGWCGGHDKKSGSLPRQDLRYLHPAPHRESGGPQQEAGGGAPRQRRAPAPAAHH